MGSPALLLSIRSYLLIFLFVAYCFCERDVHGPGLCRSPALFCDACDLRLTGDFIIHSKFIHIDKWLIHVPQQRTITMASSTGTPSTIRPDPNRLGVGRFKRHNSSFVAATVSLTPNHCVSFLNLYALASIITAIRSLPLVISAHTPWERFMTSR